MFERARKVLENAVAAHAFPCAVVEVGERASPLWSACAGRWTFDRTARPVEVADIFDLASLTKVIATATAIARLATEGALRLDDRLRAFVPEWRARLSSELVDATLADCLAHRAGFPAHVPLYRMARSLSDACQTALQLAPAYAPRSRSLYSDLGFVALSLVCERASGRPLRALFDRIATEARESWPGYLPDAGRRARCVPTGYDGFRSHCLAGEVHDTNCWAFGGVAGHAGLFGTAAEVGAFARAILAALHGEPTPIGASDVMRAFVRRDDTPGSSRALGWDTMLPTSSCGSKLSPEAIGHTGFTGTSLWLDPSRNLYVVMLTNRVYPDATNQAIHAVRRAFHEAVADGLAAQRCATAGLDGLPRP